MHRPGVLVDMTPPARILIVANQTADSPQLRFAVSTRASAGPCSFTLLVPASPHGLHRVVDPEDHGGAEAQGRLEDALPALSAAAGTRVAGVVGSHDPLAAVEDALNLLGFDEVILSTLPARISRWLRVDLAHKVRGLGLPVTEVRAGADADFVRPAA